MKLVPISVTRSISRTMLQTKKHSPHILFAGGMVGVVTSTVLACRATLKLDKVSHEIKTDLEAVKSMKNDPDVKADYTDREYAKDLIYVYSKSISRLTRLYGPSALLGGISIAAITSSHIQLHRRNEALTVTLAAVSKAFDEYRIRVAEEVGEERESKIYRGVREEEREIEGKKKVVEVRDSQGHSPYARLFDEGSGNFTKNAEHNRIFLQCQQNYANHRLQALGHVFLNEVYEWLGLDHSTPGAVVGWLSEGEGDGYVDFGINNESCMNDSWEPRIWVDFNVDGVIYDRI